jgi:hypothetical protein
MGQFLAEPAETSQHQAHQRVMFQNGPETQTAAKPQKPKNQRSAE